MLILKRFPRLVSGAPDGVLRFAGPLFGNPSGHEFSIASHFAQPFLQSTFELVADACDAIRVDADVDQRIRGGPSGILCLASLSLGGPVGYKLRITNDFAQTFSQSPFELVANRPNSILVHDIVLRILARILSGVGGVLV
jgi:hypothetical protein